MFFKKLLLIIAMCAAVRGSSALGLDDSLKSAMTGLADSARAMSIVNMELGIKSGDKQADSPVEKLLKSAGLNADDQEDISDSLSQSGDTMTFTLPADSAAAASYSGSDLEQAGSDRASTGAFNIESWREYVGEEDINNKTGYAISPDELMGSGIDIRLDSDGPQVLIIHTHGSEAFRPEGDDIYVPSDPSRTEDRRYNVVRLGDVLCKKLTAGGIQAVHDTVLYDYPSYTGSYSRAYSAIQSWLSSCPSIKIIIDIHRDAIDNPDGTCYGSTVTVDGKPSAQVMLVVGTDYSGLDHPQWRENLKLATLFQASMNCSCPGLSRPMTLTQYRYNQHSTTGSLIVEIGYSGNSLQEALQAAEHFGDTMADVLVQLVDAGASAD
ncbi:MAG: stage II sporulation protein P [Oscillospiraceae bacterium]|nr:stage II sporulation protein P [Oscillospiraceae bacterium]